MRAPARASVTIDSAPAGQTPLAVRLARGHPHQVLVAAPAQAARAAGDHRVRHHAIAHSEARDALPKRVDLAREFEAEDVSGRVRWSGIAAHALEQIRHRARVVLRVLERHVLILAVADDQREARRGVDLRKVRRGELAHRREQQNARQ